MIEGTADLALRSRHVSRDCKHPRKDNRPNISGVKKGVFTKNKLKMQIRGTSVSRPAIKDRNRGFSRQPPEGRSKKAYVIEYSDDGHPQFREPEPEDCYEDLVILMQQTGPADLAPFIGLTVSPGSAVVDSAAEEGVIGLSQMEPYEALLQDRGLKVLWQSSGGSCVGVGGSAVQLGTFLAP